jgi:hypothetical protein
MKKARWILTGAILALLLLGFALPILADTPAVSITVSKWAQAPLAPTNFTITQTGVASINITWAMGTAANITIVRGSTNGYPFSIFDGDAVYSGNLTYVEVGSLDLATYTYYYRAWSQNEYGTSSTYAQDSIGAEETAGVDMSELIDYLSNLLEGPMGIANMFFVAILIGVGVWRKGWIRAITGLGVIIWGIFALKYDIKVAAPLLAIGMVLFFTALTGLISQYRQDREEEA